MSHWLTTTDDNELYTDDTDHADRFPCSSV